MSLRPNANNHMGEGLLMQEGNGFKPERLEPLKGEDPQHTALLRHFAGKPNSHDYPEDWPHENGNYMCECCLCHEFFMGHKRRIICRECRDKENE